MSAALQLYEQLTEATDEKTRARLIAEAYDALAARFPQISDIATEGQLRETELRLQKEIKQVEAKLTRDIKEVEAKLTRDIKEVEAKLTREIKELETRLMREIKEIEVGLHKAMAAQTRWLLGGLAVLGAVFKLADLLIP